MTSTAHNPHVFPGQAKGNDFTKRAMAAVLKRTGATQSPFTASTPHAVIRHQSKHPFRMKFVKWLWRKLLETKPKRPIGGAIYSRNAAYSWRLGAAFCRPHGNAKVLPLKRKLLPIDTPKPAALTVHLNQLEFGMIHSRIGLNRSNLEWNAPSFREQVTGA